MVTFKSTIVQLSSIFFHPFFVSSIHSCLHLNQVLGFQFISTIALLTKHLPHSLPLAFFLFPFFSVLSQGFKYNLSESMYKYYHTTLSIIREVTVYIHFFSLIHCHIFHLQALLVITPQHIAIIFAVEEMSGYFFSNGLESKYFRNCGSHITLGEQPSFFAFVFMIVSKCKISFLTSRARSLIL